MILYEGLNLPIGVGTGLSQPGPSDTYMEDDSSFIECNAECCQGAHGWTKYYSLYVNYTNDTPSATQIDSFTTSST